MTDMVVQRLSFKALHTLVVTGVPNADCNKFNINIGNNADEIALHIDLRFKFLAFEHKVALNSYQLGKWGQEQIVDYFPFKRGEIFKVRITFSKTEFMITLPNYFTITFPNRFGADLYNYMFVVGDGRILGIKME